MGFNSTFKGLKILAEEYRILAEKLVPCYFIRHKSYAAQLRIE